jgi:hypothetical protein
MWSGHNILSSYKLFHHALTTSAQIFTQAKGLPLGKISFADKRVDVKTDARQKLLEKHSLTKICASAHKAK